MHHQSSWWAAFGICSLWNDSYIKSCPKETHKADRWSISVFVMKRRRSGRVFSALTGTKILIQAAAEMLRLYVSANHGYLDWKFFIQTSYGDTEQVTVESHVVLRCWLFYATLFHATLFHATLFHATLFSRYVFTLRCFTLRCFTLRCFTLRCFHATFLRYVALRYVVLRYIALCYVALRYVVSRYVVSRYVVWHYVVWHYVVWRYVVWRYLFGICSWNMPTMNYSYTLSYSLNKFTLRCLDEKTVLDSRSV